MFFPNIPVIPYEGAKSKNPIPKSFARQHSKNAEKNRHNYKFTPSDSALAGFFTHDFIIFFTSIVEIFRQLYPSVFQSLPASEQQEIS